MQRAKVSMTDSRSKVESYPFHFTQAVNLAVGVGSVSLAPASFTRLLSIADNYALYRFVELRFRLHPSNASNGTQGMC